MKKLFFILFSILAFSSCIPNISNAVSPTDLIYTRVLFSVQVPANTSDDANVQLVTIDEISGIPHNRQFYPMQRLSPIHFGIVLELPLRSNFSYYYANQEEFLIKELNSINQPIGIRYYFVDGEAEVKDIVAKWNVDDPDVSTGRIEGQVLSLEGIPLANILIKVAGETAVTTTSGHFWVDNIITGTHSLTALSPDGSFLPYKHLIEIIPNGTTPVDIYLKTSQLVKVTFEVKLPSTEEGGLPIGIAGNITQLGYQFVDLGGGLFVNSTRMPQLKYLEDNTYQLTITLPAGTVIEYKYSLGDGFWNAERNSNGQLFTRKIYLDPKETHILLEDEISSFAGIDTQPFWINLSAPDDTPLLATASIQLRIGDWMPPLPLWSAGNNKWAYQLHIPTEYLGNVTGRICLNAECGNTFGITIPNNGQTIFFNNETPSIINIDVESWQYVSQKEIVPFSLSNQEILPRLNTFVSGVNLNLDYHPTSIENPESTIISARALNANQIIFSPTWSYSEYDAIFLVQYPNQDIPLSNLLNLILAAKEAGMSVSLSPQLNPNDVKDFQSSIGENEIWWNNWFESYTKMAIHHALLAQKLNMETLILGGDWMSQTLPQSIDGNNSNPLLPGNIEELWNELIGEIRKIYSGKIGWQISQADLDYPPTFIFLIDELYIEWGADLTSRDNHDISTLKINAESIIDQKIYPLYVYYGKPILISLNYPSIENSASNCISLPNCEQDCAPIYLTSPYYSDGAHQINLELQANIYQAVLSVVNEKDWITGVISQGFNPSMSLLDHSSSVRGKPAQYILAYWFLQFRDD